MKRSRIRWAVWLSLLVFCMAVFPAAAKSGPEKAEAPVSSGGDAFPQAAAGAPQAVFTATEYERGVLSGLTETMSYSLDGKNYKTPGAESVLITGMEPCTIYVRDRLADGSYSAVQTITVTRMPLPQVTKVDMACPGWTGRIRGVDPGMQYREVSEPFWTPVTGNEITQLGPLEYRVRRVAAGTQLASGEVSVTIVCLSYEHMYLTGICMICGDYDPNYHSPNEKTQPPTPPPTQPPTEPPTPPPTQPPTQPPTEPPTQPPTQPGSTAASSAPAPSTASVPTDPVQPSAGDPTRPSPTESAAASTGNVPRSSQAAQQGTVVPPTVPAPPSEGTLFSQLRVWILLGAAAILALVLLVVLWIAGMRHK